MSIKPPVYGYLSPQLFIGNIYLDFYSTYVTQAHNSLCNIAGEEGLWQMENTSLVFGDYSYPFNVTNSPFLDTTVQFATHITATSFPIKYIDTFLKYFPKDCHKEILTPTVYVINCPDLDSVSNISFKLNNSLVLLQKIVFRRINVTSREDILFLPFRKDLKKVMIGLDFFSSYHILSSVVLHPLNFGQVTNLSYVPDQSSNFWLIFGIK